MNRRKAWPASLPRLTKNYEAAHDSPPVLTSTLIRTHRCVLRLCVPVCIGVLSLSAPATYSKGVDGAVTFDLTIDLTDPSPVYAYMAFPRDVSPDKYKVDVKYTSYMRKTITDLTLSRGTTGEKIVDNALAYCGEILAWPEYDFWATGNGNLSYHDGGYGYSAGAFIDHGNGYEARRAEPTFIEWSTSRKWTVNSWWGWRDYRGVEPYFEDNGKRQIIKARCTIPRGQIVASGGGWLGTDDITVKATTTIETYTGYGYDDQYGTPIFATQIKAGGMIYTTPSAAVGVASNTGIQGVPSRITCNLIAGQPQYCTTLNFSTTGGTSEVRVRRNQSRGTMDLGGTIITSQWSNVRPINTSGAGFGRVSQYVLPMTLNLDSASRLDDAITIEMIYK